jgi:hypothetical protein
MMQADRGVNEQASTYILSNSIWGNIILKLAYKRDEKLQKLAKKLNMVNFGAMNSYLSVAGITLGQNIVSMACLNPPPGIEDSYGPGSIGLVSTGLTNIVLNGQIVLGYGIKSKIKRRQREIQQEVEAILEHLEYSQTECPDAERQLAQLVGSRASAECIELWRSCHVTASIAPTEPQSGDKAENKSPVGKVPTGHAVESGT